MGVDIIPESLVNPTRDLMKKFGMEYSDNYGENILQLFFIIKTVIFKKPEFKRVLKAPNESKENGRQNGS